MRSKYGSKISLNYLIHSILFRSVKGIWTDMPKNLSLVGQESCPQTCHSGSSCTCRRLRHLRPGLTSSGRLSTRFFGYRAQVLGLDLNELFRVGRRALAIGLTVLSFCIIVGQTAAAHLAPRPIGRVIEESLTISGWVANWRPIQIFLYDWWPIVRQRNLYRRLSAAKVELRPYKNDHHEQRITR